MSLRYLLNELIEFFARPLPWIAFVVASIIVLVGLEQLNLDVNRARILILDGSVGQTAGTQVQKLVQEISGVATFLRAPRPDVVRQIDDENADIVLMGWENRWQATVRSRSIQDHRRLARLGFAIATVINRQTPWDAVVGSDLMSRLDYGKSVCSVGARMCTAYRFVGHPQFDKLCSTVTDATTKRDGPATGSGDGDAEGPSCDGERGAILKEARAVDRALRQFCDPNQIHPDQSRGICGTASAPALLSVVGLSHDLGTHTRAFVPRTICLLIVFAGFVFGCRSVLIDVRNNTLNTWAAAFHGRIIGLLAAKVVVATLYCLLLLGVLLVFASAYFGLTIKNGLPAIALLIVVGAFSSVLLGVVVGLLVSSEASAYLAGSIYLLLLFILSGYIDTIGDGNVMIWLTSYVLPLKYMMAPFSSWMIFGASPPWTDMIPSALLSQCLGAVAALLLATEYHHRTV